MQDHVASHLKERERVIKAGGYVRWQVDTWRVGSAALQVYLNLLFAIYNSHMKLLTYFEHVCHNEN